MTRLALTTVIAVLAVAACEVPEDGVPAEQPVEEETDAATYDDLHMDEFEPFGGTFTEDTARTPVGAQ